MNTKNGSSSRYLSTSSSPRVIVTGNCDKVTHDRLAARGDTTSLKRGVSPATSVEKKRDLYYTSDTHASVQQCRLLVRKTITRLRARPFTPFSYYVTDYRLTVPECRQRVTSSTYYSLGSVIAPFEGAGFEVQADIARYTPAGSVDHSFEAVIAPS
jgi:hypothetical protein